MCFGMIQAGLLACFFVATTRSEFPDQSSIVFPEVYEQRTDESEKVLVIADSYSLNLVKASVLSDRVMLRVSTESRVTKRYVDGPYHERHLYQDTSKQASLIVKPLRGGHYHVTGLLNFTHRIEPLASQERYSSNIAAHMISKVILKNGTSDADASLVDGFEDLKLPAITLQERALNSFIIEVYSISDSRHTAHFGQDTGLHFEYLIAYWNSVSLRMQQLTPPGYIALVGIEMSLTDAHEDYLYGLPDKELVSNETLITLTDYAWLNRQARLADITFLITGRDLVELIPGGVKNSTAGIAYLGQACRVHKVGIAEDDPALFSGVHVAVHEIGHLLSSYHDGERSSSGCPAKDGYIMNPYNSGRNRFTFSNCSKRAIAAFLGLHVSYCLRDHNPRRHHALLPNDTMKLPGQIMNGDQYCKRNFPHPQVTYIKAANAVTKYTKGGMNNS
ncbi:venom metalloproteinase antarease-like TtrivMP_A [Rhipicephalus sanguineus]|uniref:venom metalloproteinase antarease-like TtrivMP_A n=1 Tax=Rhipicephalus sanguineus TaxID=34632 RepID=UPI0020C51AE0|nr:venom metalloproteinase antarease-like TtrivMP_A [Rhipicephalus sanguineus]